MRTRTNLHIDNDALKIASYYADAKGIKLGSAVSELIRKAEQAPEPPLSASSRLKRDKYGFLVMKATGRTITSEMVKEMSEDDLTGGDMRTTLTLDDKLIKQAQEYTGIQEKSALVRKALKTLIEWEASRRLALLGGSDPGLKPIPRRRVSGRRK